MSKRPISSNYDRSSIFFQIDCGLSSLVVPSGLSNIIVELFFIPRSSYVISLSIILGILVNVSFNTAWFFMIFDDFYEWYEITIDADWNLLTFTRGIHHTLRGGTCFKNGIRGGNRIP